jgi:tetratricopeptide (TPR) repeat protein
MLLYLLERNDEALKALEEACRIEPRSFDYLMALTLLYEQEGQRTKAIETLRKMNALRPNDPIVANLLQRIMATRGAE